MDVKPCINCGRIERNANGQCIACRKAAKAKYNATPEAKAARAKYNARSYSASQEALMEKKSRDLVTESWALINKLIAQGPPTT